MKKYSKDTKFNSWSLFKEKQRGLIRFVIRRWVINSDGTKILERLRLEKYKSIRSDETELKDFIIRLNDEQFREERGRAKVALKHAFISPDLLDSYQNYLLTQIPTKAKARSEYQPVTLQIRSLA